MDHPGGTLKFCGQSLTEKEWKLLLELVEEFWGISRTELASTICELLDWKRPNGKLKTVECGLFLKDLESRGLIGLPKRRGQGRQKSREMTWSQSEEVAEIIASGPAQLGGVKFVRIDNSRALREWKELVDRYHYLGYKQAFGAQLRYLVVCGLQERPLACLQYSSPAWKVSSRDAWIGWSPRQREKNLQHIVQNSRFLILPWVKVKNLASTILGRACRHLPIDWQALYGYRPLLLETFVEERFAGTSYRAANWVELGSTRGRGRMDRKHRNAEPVKTVWVYPLCRDAEKQLAAKK
ncbi:MAG: DUF4338 domain-containing protein [Acidobacteriota bacterium]|nr:DUF4338 domain-containing protein [Acidobacteriota bacterium]